MPKKIEDHPIKGLKPDFRTTEDQIYYSQWESRNVTVKFAGKCVVCGNRVYQPTDEAGRPYDPDPRGVFGDHHAAAHLVATEYSMTGADVVMCFDCSNTREKYEQGLAVARGQWKAVEA